MSYQIVTANPEHIRALRNRLRAEDREEILCAGSNVPRALWRSYRGSLIRKAVILDGQVAAVWGCAGSPMGQSGEPWLLTAPEIERIPKAFVREARIEAGKMLGLFPLLQNMVAARYGRACKFLEVVGFRLDDAVPFGPDKHLFRRFWMER